MKSIKLKPGKIKYYLVFFLFASLACSRHKTIDKPQLVEKYGQITAVKFYTNEETSGLKITLKGENNPAILGKLLWNTDHFEFVPLIPFTAGQTYELRSKSDLISEFTIPNSSSKNNVRLTSWYPEKDTIPQNLLKMYLEFSEPMNRVQDPLKFITVTDKNSGEIVPIFLSLENPLWNKNHTLLTLWLEPGRIKSDLVPNKESGMPLSLGNSYSIEISKNWASSLGSVLDKNYSRNFYITSKDTLKPSISDLKITEPKANSLESLIVNYTDDWDLIVLIDIIALNDANGTAIEGEWEISGGNNKMEFQPSVEWTPGKYTLTIESKAEDLAGNNLLRLFDQDIKSKPNTSVAETEKSISFQVKE